MRQRCTFDFTHAVLDDGTTRDVTVYGRWQDAEPDVGFMRPWFEHYAIHDTETEQDLTDSIHGEWLIGAINAINSQYGDND